MDESARVDELRLARDDVEERTRSLKFNVWPRCTKGWNSFPAGRKEGPTLADHQLIFFAAEHDDLSNQIGKWNALIHAKSTR